jgi:prephenate dehydrogenase
LYPSACITFLQKHRENFKSGAIVTDISGVKTTIFRELHAFLRADVDYIPGHPMAGSEKEGFVHASGSIFQNRNYILMPIPENRPQNIEIFKNILSYIGFSRVIETDSATHDHKIAFTSQLCHIIAAALVDSAEDTRITAFGGGSFEDLTRIAMINAPLWTELFLANRDELLAHIDKFERALGNVKNMIERNDKAALEQNLQETREKRIAMSRIEGTNISGI